MTRLEEDSADLICRECGEQYDDGGDGYDGLCPSCADKEYGKGDEDHDPTQSPE